MKKKIERKFIIAMFESSFGYNRTSPTIIPTFNPRFVNYNWMQKSNERSIKVSM